MLSVLLSRFQWSGTCDKLSLIIVTGLFENFMKHFLAYIMYDRPIIIPYSRFLRLWKINKSMLNNWRISYLNNVPQLTNYFHNLEQQYIPTRATWKNPSILVIIHLFQSAFNLRLNFFSLLLISGQNHTSIH